MSKESARIDAAVMDVLQKLFDQEFRREHVALLRLSVVGHRRGGAALLLDIARKYPDEPVIIIPPKGTRPLRLPSLFTARPRKGLAEPRGLRTKYNAKYPGCYIAFLVKSWRLVDHDEDGSVLADRLTRRFKRARIVVFPPHGLRFYLQEV